MPTGCTYKIEDDPDFTFPDYVWGCARAFGDLIEIREDPANAPIPAKLQPSRYHFDQIEEIRAELDVLDKMSADDVVRAIRSEVEEAERDNAESLEKHTRVHARYAAMRERVEAWEPPTPDHVGLKDFMLSQIDESVRWDGLYQRGLPTTDPAEWLADRRASLVGDLKYHETGLDEEIARTDQRNAWLDRLRESVPMGGGKTPADATSTAGGESWRDREALL